MRRNVGGGAKQILREKAGKIGSNGSEKVKQQHRGQNFAFADLAQEANPGLF